MKQRLPSVCAVAMTLLATAVAVTAIEASSDADGFLYGTVTTRSGTEYTGVLRWSDEEAFWDDLFHSAKVELPYRENAERVETDDSWWKAMGRKLGVDSVTGASTRVFIARFGDIDTISVTGKNAADVKMRSGTTYEVEGYANDVGATIMVGDPTLGDVGIEWKNIDTIVFAPTPDDVETAGTRLRGTVSTRAGDFEGYIQWDSEECLSIDSLDGSAADGKMSIEMGSIRSIERRGSSSSLVILSDGRELELEGTNDVNSSIRGILVEDARFGRVKVPWQMFERVEFLGAGSSGRGYDAYPVSRKLQGTVTTSGGAQHSGRIIFDLDESESWEMVNGSNSEIEYNIPFHLIATLEPRGTSNTVVNLRDGDTLRLEDGQDVSSGNDGVLVIAGAEEHYVPWDVVRRVEFDWAE